MIETLFLINYTVTNLILKGSKKYIQIKHIDQN